VSTPQSGNYEGAEQCPLIPARDPDCRLLLSALRAGKASASAKRDSLGDKLKNSKVRGWYRKARTNRRVGEHQKQDREASDGAEEADADQPSPAEAIRARAKRLGSKLVGDTTRTLHNVVRRAKMVRAKIAGNEGSASHR